MVIPNFPAREARDNKYPESKDNKPMLKKSGPLYFT